MLSLLLGTLTPSAQAVEFTGPLFDSYIKGALAVGVFGALGHIVGNKLDNHADIGAALGGLLGITIDHYLFDGKNADYSIARILGYITVIYCKVACDKKREGKSKQIIVLQS